MSDSATFSIITVCKNPGKSFQLTLENLQRQIYRKFEYVVVDGASTDGTVAEIQKNKHIITKFVSEPDNGIYAAMNKGVQLASGKYTYFLNCGDTFYDEQVLNRISECAAQSDGDFIYGDTCVIDPSNGHTYVKKHEDVDKYYLFNAPINHQAIFAKRSLFYKVGLFDTSYVMKADHEWTLRCYNSGATFIHTPVVVANYLLHGFSYQNKGKYRAVEKKRIQKQYFHPSGRLLVRIANRIKITPGKFLRPVLNKFL
jgi:glycosyltransferase involved in cell wall biosynthesis